MKQTMWIGVAVVLLAAVLGFEKESGGEASADQVHSIELPTIPTELPPAPGRESVGTCALCHSPRYILNQPPLSRKQWTAEVDKMRKTFGAPIPESQVPTIIDYLVAIRGTEGSK